MIDDIDVSILKQLQKDARLSFAEVGRTIKLSASAVRERILKMEDTGVIKKYGIEIDHSKVGYDLEAFILVKVFHGKLKLLLSTIPSISEIEKAYRITGNQNIHLKVILKNQLHLQQLIDKLMPFGDTHTLLILSDVSSNDS
ncbi:AsnC family transcriptional regulator [Aquimarina sp. D1M17]|uniref:Lrp/AsnC family transcriptional regulator n=1 Tax=Aquimarina acroporae TaxID=2937283 RepID=UPI0020C0AFD3|nr:AsnC family transcriptional regulator [Aquimarina acroporae]MCK8523484.1 AsnC family transcriptional regulator [Aquimarina acroporae]